MKILALHAGTLGDCVLALHVVNALRHFWKASSVTMVARSPIARWAKRQGLLSEALSFEHQEVRGLYSQGHSLPTETARFLQRFDRIVSFLGAMDDTVSKKLVALPGPEVLAIDPRAEDAATRDGIHITNQWTRQIARHGYEVPTAPATVHLSTSEKRTRREHLGNRLGTGPGHVVLCHPGSGGSGKCCSIDALERLVETLASRGRRVGWMVGPDEVERFGPSYVQRLQRSAPVIFEESVETAADLVSGADRYIGHDAGMTHVAGLVRVPTIVLFGPTDPRVWRPLADACEIVGFPPGDAPPDEWIEKILTRVDTPEFPERKGASPCGC